MAEYLAKGRDSEIDHIPATEFCAPKSIDFTHCLLYTSYRRQLILTTKDKPLSRVDDPDIAEKMAAEVEGILLWALEGLQRLVKNLSLIHI